MANNMQYLCCITEADVCSNNDDDVQRHFLQTQFASKYISEGTVDVRCALCCKHTLVDSGYAKLDHTWHVMMPQK